MFFLLGFSELQPKKELLKPVSRLNCTDSGISTNFRIFCKTFILEIEVFLVLQLLPTES
jgi:hypothetical protein